jgi:hypothetical protein
VAGDGNCRHVPLAEAHRLTSIGASAQAMAQAHPLRILEHFASCAPFQLFRETLESPYFPKLGGILALFTLTCASYSGAAHSACNECVRVTGEIVSLTEVGVVEGSHYFARTTDGRSVVINPNGYRLAQMALLSGSRFYVNTPKKRIRFIRSDFPRHGFVENPSAMPDDAIQLGTSRASPIKRVQPPQGLFYLKMKRQADALIVILLLFSC